MASVSTMTSGSPITATPAARRWGVGFAAIWLFFLADPLKQAWDTRDTAAGVVGGVATIVFGAYYMTIWLNLRRDRNDFAGPPSTVRSVTYMVVLLFLAGVMIATLGQAGTAALVYCAVAAVMIFSLRVAGLIVVALAGLVVLLVRLNPGWSSPVSLLFSVFAAALAVFGIRQMMARNIDLVRAHQKNAELAVENERTRFARDLHDILGHSLTVITVKAELANRLLDVDVERARAELADLERLSRDALADVRRAVEGYRELTLPGELARARTALAAAEIEAELPNSTDEVPSHLRELFAWTVREGVTNVIRHSGATRCTVRLLPDAAEVVDDGVGAGPASGDGAGDGRGAGGSGLVGLRERAAAVGGTVTTEPAEPRGHLLRVAVG
jgi:two-component system, NarL family, sensor histidine kinase DesK